MPDQYFQLSNALIDDFQASIENENVAFIRDN